jgi:ribonucleoside-diphosphate reductase subunit M1
MWDVKPSDLWEWDSLKEQIKEHGTRNSLLLAPMPTASTSQILGNNECFEPYTSNIYQRRVLAGEFQVVNPWLLKDLVDTGLWSDAMKNRIIAENGSIQNIPNIPEDIKALYKTVWEISQRQIVQMAADRGAFIDQSQSLNIHMKDPTMGKITSMHFTGWKLGLKTGMYYLRTQAAAAPIQFTVDQEALKIADTTISKDRVLKKRAPPPGSSYMMSSPSAVPRPASAKREGDSGNSLSSNGVPTPTTTPPPAVSRPLASPHKAPPMKADVDEGDSPKVLPTEPLDAVNDEELSKKPNQSEDKDEDNEERERDIYSDAVLACKLH